MPVRLSRLKWMCICILSLMLPAMLVVQPGCVAPTAGKAVVTAPATAPAPMPAALGPVTLWLPDEADAFIDLDTGRTLAAPDDLLEQPERMRDWASREGIDLFWQPGRLAAWLVVLDAAMVPADDDAWSRADESAGWEGLEAATRIAGSHPIECVPSRLPIVLRVKTREGGLGIVRIAPALASRGLSGLEVYYRMMETPSAAPLVSLADDARADLLKTLHARRGELARQILQLQAQADPDDPRIRHLESVADALARRIAAMEQADRQAAEAPATQPSAEESPATQPEEPPAPDGVDAPVEAPATLPATTASADPAAPAPQDDHVLPPSQSDLLPGTPGTPDTGSTREDADARLPANAPAAGAVNGAAPAPPATPTEPPAPVSAPAISSAPAADELTVQPAASMPASAPVSSNAPASPAVEAPPPANLLFADMPSRFADGECLQGLPRPVILQGDDRPVFCKSDRPLLFDMHHTPMPTKLLLDASAGPAAAYDTLYVDFDNDGDFAEHRPYVATPFAGLMFPDAEPVVLYFRDVHIPRNLAQNRSSHVQIFIEQLPGWPEDVTALHPRIIPQRWAAGTVLLGDQPVPAAIIDRNWDDTFITRAGLNADRPGLPRGDYLLLALDGETELLPCDLKEGVGSLRLVLNDYLAIDDRIYRVEATRRLEGIRLALVPTEAPTGTLTLDTVPPAGRLVLIGEKTTAIVHQPGRQLRLPIDTYWSPQLGGRLWRLEAQNAPAQAP